MRLQALIQELYQGYTKIWESKGEQNRESLLLGNSYNRVVEEETTDHFNVEKQVPVKQVTLACFEGHDRDSNPGADWGLVQEGFQQEIS